MIMTDHIQQDTKIPVTLSRTLGVGRVTLLGVGALLGGEQVSDHLLRSVGRPCVENVASVDRAVCGRDRLRDGERLVLQDHD